MANDSRIGILLEEKRIGQGAIKAVSADLSGINNAAGIAAGGLDALAGALGAVAVVELGKQAFDLAKLAAEAGRTRTAFDNLAAGVGQSGDEMLSAMQKASSGMISNADLVLSANRAMLLGVADTGDELGKLLEVARVRGQAMGLSVSQAFNDLVTGLGRMSPLILDNLGIVTGGEKVFDDYAKSLGRTAASLTDAEKKQALFNKVVTETQPLIDASAGAGTDAAGSFEQMSASLDNARIAVGELLLALGLPEAINVFTQSIEDSQKQIESFIGAIDGVKNKINELQTIDAQNVLSDIGPQLTEAVAQYNQALNDFQNAAITGGPAAGNLQPLAGVIKELDERIKEMAADYNAAAAVTGAPLIDVAQLSAGVVAFEDVSSALRDVGPAGAAAAGGIDLASEAARGSIPAMRAAALAAAELKIQFDNASSAAGGLRLRNDLINEQFSDSNLQKIRDTREEAAKYTNANTEAGRKAFTASLALATFNQALDDQDAALKKTKTGLSEAEKAYNSLKDRVAGVLSAAQGDIAGIDLEKILPHEDAIAENARRLADIAVNGFKNQDWLGEFRAQVPEIFKALEESGDPKGTAARILKNFQDGLVPELIDKEKAKDLVRRMILGEQQADALATEIAQELAAEFGAGAPANLNELVGQALGTGAAGQGAAGGSQAGADAAQSFAQSFVGAAASVGSQIAASLKADSVIALIKDAAKAAGQQWGDMFLSVVGDNVPASLVSLLTDLVTPNVQAKLAAQASLTGAK